MREFRQPHNDYSYVYSRYRDPIATIEQGETVAIYTIDAFGDVITTEQDLPSKTLGA